MLDFEKGLQQQNSDIEDFINHLREWFKGLRSKLEETQETIKNAEQKAGRLGSGVVTATVILRGGRRFMSRKDPNWYPCIENLLFGYIRGNKTDEELKTLIELLDQDPDQS